KTNGTLLLCCHFLSCEFIRQRMSLINIANRFQDGPAIDRNRASFDVGEEVIQHQRLNVAVEDDADEFALGIDDGATRVAANDVGSIHEVERRIKVDPPFGLVPAFGKLEIADFPVSFAVLVSASHSGEGGD